MHVEWRANGNLVTTRGQTRAAAMTGGRLRLTGDDREAAFPLICVANG